MSEESTKLYKTICVRFMLKRMSIMWRWTYAHDGNVTKKDNFKKIKSKWRRDNNGKIEMVDIIK